MGSSAARQRHHVCGPGQRPEAVRINLARQVIVRVNMPVLRKISREELVHGLPFIEQVDQSFIDV
jgi:hypothetical protein